MKQEHTTSNPMIESVVAAARRKPPAKTLDARLGPFWTVVSTSAGAGMASTLRSGGHMHGSVPLPSAGSLTGLAPEELVDLLRSESVLEASVGLAAANALLGPAAGDLPRDNARNILEERAVGRRTAMIGRFPFAEDLREKCARLMVFERGLDRREGDFGEEAMEQLLPEAEVVAVTATTLLNRTLPGVLACVRPDAFLMMLGPSTPLTTELFEFGFDVLCGTVVEDADSVIRAAGEGAVTSQIEEVRRVSLWKDRN
jgi:uncharacterized protein (DUF4213/DUF364 family)